MHYFTNNGKLKVSIWIKMVLEPDGSRKFLGNYRKKIAKTSIYVNCTAKFCESIRSLGKLLGIKDSKIWSNKPLILCKYKHKETEYWRGRILVSVPHSQFISFIIHKFNWIFHQFTVRFILSMESTKISSLSNHIAKWNKLI